VRSCELDSSVSGYFPRASFYVHGNKQGKRLMMPLTSSNVIYTE